jgi:Protein of unknown function (DUF3126)
VKKHEIPQLQKFVRKAFGNPGLLVTADPKSSDTAALHLGERRLGSIVVDDEDGDRSFSMDIKLPVERAALQPYLRLLFENEGLKLVARGKKVDSVELNNGDEFLGIISADDAKLKSFTFQMAILDLDLEEL